MLKKLSVLALVAVFAVGGDTPSQGIDPLPAVGTIEGTVTLEQARPGRTVSRRYTTAPARRDQQLPAVAYLVGTIAGSPPAGGGASPMIMMTQRDTAFVPSVVTIRVGDSVGFPNDDPFLHNVTSESSTHRFDLGGYPAGQSKEETFGEPGIVELFCQVHEFMRGAIIVTENPFHAVVGEDGTFRIEGVPEGVHTIAFWHTDHQPLERTVMVTAGGTALLQVALER